MRRLTSAGRVAKKKWPAPGSSARALLQAMRREPAEAFAKALGPPDIDRRADVLSALCIGVASSHRMLADGPLATMSSDELMAALISHAVDLVRLAQ